MALSTGRSLVNSLALTRLQRSANSDTKALEAEAPEAEPPHPLDPLSSTEIERAIAAVRKTQGDGLRVKVVWLQQPSKHEMILCIETPRNDALYRNYSLPKRVADVVDMDGGSKLCSALVELSELRGKFDRVVRW